MSAVADALPKAAALGDCLRKERRLTSWQICVSRNS